MATQYDQQYNQLIFDILQKGVWDRDQKVRTRWADDQLAYTKSIVSTQLQFNTDLRIHEVPILTSKKVAWKTAIKELLWIWQMKSNDVRELRKMGVKIWDEWEQDGGPWDGTIGASYGYQMGKKVRRHISHISHGPNAFDDFEVVEKLDQVDHLLHQLENNPASRRHVTSLWDIEDLDSMALNPCVWNTQWLIKEGYLHLIVGIRSNDIALGNPFNVFQYYVLQRMIAQVTRYRIGSLTFNINDAHIYDRHVDELQKQIFLPTYDAPTLTINPDIKNFYDFTIDDFELTNYQSGPAIKMEVAI